MFQAKKRCVLEQTVKQIVWWRINQARLQSKVLKHWILTQTEYLNDNNLNAGNWNDEQCNLFICACFDGFWIAHSSWCTVWKSRFKVKNVWVYLTGYSFVGPCWSIFGDWLWWLKFRIIRNFGEINTAEAWI